MNNHPPHLRRPSPAATGFWTGVVLLITAYAAPGFGSGCLFAVLSAPLYPLLFLTMWIGSLARWDVEHIALFSAFVMPLASPFAFALIGWGIGKVYGRVRLQNNDPGGSSS